MDPKLLLKSSKIVGSAPKIQLRKKKPKNRPSSFELEKCFLKPHSSKTQIALVTGPGGSRRRPTEAPPHFDSDLSISKAQHNAREAQRGHHGPREFAARPMRLPHAMDQAILCPLISTYRLFSARVPELHVPLVSMKEFLQELERSQANLQLAQVRIDTSAHRKAVHDDQRNAEVPVPC